MIPVMLARASELQTGDMVYRLPGIENAGEGWHRVSSVGTGTCGAKGRILVVTEQDTLLGLRPHREMSADARLLVARPGAEVGG